MATEQHAEQAGHGSPEGSDTMRAAMFHEYGNSEVLQPGRTDVPVIADNEVLVQVRAAGLDRGVWHVVAGKPYAIRLAMGLRRPRHPIPGVDVSGTIAAIGPAVTGLGVGDEVFGFGKGTFAEYAVARADQLVLKPAGLTFEQAAVVPVSGGTALQALAAAGVKAADRVLITGASGGVGSYAVQLAKHLGAEVAAEAGPGKQDLVRGLGADRTFDYTREDFAEEAGRFDAIIDIAGNPRLARLRRALASQGTAVIVGGEGAGAVTGMGRQVRALALSPFLRQRLTVLMARQRTADLHRLAMHLAAGTLVPHIGATFPLERAAEALAMLEGGSTRGKTAIVV